MEGGIEPRVPSRVPSRVSAPQAASPLARRQARRSTWCATTSLSHQLGYPKRSSAVTDFLFCEVLGRLIGHSDWTPCRLDVLVTEGGQDPDRPTALPSAKNIIYIRHCAPRLYSIEAGTFT